MKNYKKNDNVFVGPGNTAGNSYFIADALRKVGINAVSYSYYEHEFGFRTDYCVKQLRISKSIKFKKILRIFYLNPINFLIRLLFFLKSLLIYNTFFFISPFTFLPSHFDLKILKLFGSKIAFFFPGCCERNPHDSINLQKNSFCSLCEDYEKQKHCLCNEVDKKKYQIKTFEKYSDKIFSHRDTNGYLENENKVDKLYVMAKPSKKSLDELIIKYDEEIINIVHFPSNAKLKGTVHVLNAIERLTCNYSERFNFYSERTNNERVLLTLEKSHILIDQFNVAYGLAAVEGMSRACVVIAKLSDWFINDFPETPVVNVSEEKLYDTLVFLIENRNLLKQNAIKSYKYYLKFHTPEKVGAFYKESLKLK